MKKRHLLFAGRAPSTLIEDVYVAPESAYAVPLCELEN